MASLHRQPGKSPYWYLAFRGKDGKQHFVSTRTENRREAEVFLKATLDGKKLAQSRRLTPQSIMKIMSQVFDRLAEMQ